MSIKSRLIISYLAMIVIPVFLTIISGGLIFHAFSGDAGFLKFGPGFLQKFSRKAPEIYVTLENTLKNNPDKLLDRSFVEAIDRKLNIFNTVIFLKKDQDLIFKSNFFNDAELLKIIKNNNLKMRNKHDICEMENMHKFINHIFVNGNTYNVIFYDFSFKNNSKGTIYLVTDVGPIGKFARKYFFALIISFMIIIIFTNAVLTFLVSKSILRPLGILEASANQIKAENLNFTINCERKDEFGKVCRAFEEMRQQLQKSITEKIKYEENRKEIIASITHDLKTPITSIKGYVEGIIDGVANTPEKTEKYLKTIYSKAVLMDRLIDDLFISSKLELHNFPFNFEQLKIIDFVKEYAMEASLDMEKEGIKLTFQDHINQALLVLADREMLRRVLINIVENAVKYGDKTEKKIDITLYHDHKLVYLEILDNGKGVTQEELTRIFENFYRADSARNSTTGGSGLGLAIAKKIIIGHGGEIWAESIPGQWTKLTFTLKIF